MSARKDHEIVCVVDDLRLKGLSPSGDPPILQEPIHVQVGEQGTDHPTLRSSAGVALASRPASIPLLIPLFNRNFKPRLDQTQQVPIDDAPGDRLHQFPVRNGVKVFRQIGVDHVGVPGAEKFMHLPDGVLGASLRSVTVSVRFHVGLEDGFQHQFGCRLDHSIPDRGNSERPLAAPRLRDHHPSHWLWLVAPGVEFISEFRQPLLPPYPQLDPFEGLTIDARRALVGFCQVVRMSQNILAVDLVVEQIKAVMRFVLRLAVKLPLKRPDLTWRFQAHRQSPHLGFFESASEVRALSSPGITQVQRSYDPLRVPRRAAPLIESVGACAPLERGVPPLAQTTFPTCRAHYPGGPSRCARRFLPGSYSLPFEPGGSASTSLVSRPAQASRVLRPAGLLSHLKWPLAQGPSSSPLPG